MSQSSAPKKVKLTQLVQIVPQIGHDEALVALAFHPTRPRLCAALDATPAVQLWSLEQGETLLIAPLPPLRFTELRWLDDTRLAVRTAGPNAVWYVRSLAEHDLWRPQDQARPIDAEDGLELEEDESGSFVAVRDETRIALASPGDAHVAVLDPLHRFAILAGEHHLWVCDVDHGALLETLDHHEDTVTGIATASTGAFAASCDASGRIYRLAPLREGEPPRMIRRLRGTPTCLAIAPHADHIAVGDDQGHLVLLDAEDGQRLLKTAKRPKGYHQEFLLAETIAYVGMRPHGLSVYLETQDRVLPALPLPGFATAASSSIGERDFYVALEDGRLLCIALDTQTFTLVASTDTPLRLLAATPAACLGLRSDGLFIITDENQREVPRDDLDAITHIALSSDTKLTATFAPGRLLVTQGKRKTKTVADVDAFDAIQAMAFTTYRSKPAIAIVDEHRVLWRLDLPKGTLRRVGLIERSDVEASIAAVLALSVDDDGFLRALCISDNEHRILVGLDLATSRANTMLGVLPIQHQITVVYEDPSSIWLRQEDETAIRMVREMHPFTVEDWLRLPE